MMRHRLSVLVVIGLLAACGGSDDAEPAAEEPTTGTEEAPADESEDSGDDDSGDDGTTGDDTADDGDADTAGDDDAGGDDTGDDDASGVDTGNDDDGDDGNTVSISGLDEIPEECRQIMGDFLRQIEPLVKDVDWENSTMEELGDLMTSIEAPSNDIDTQMSQAGCDDLDFDGDDERGFDLSLELARQEAPGVVGWLEFLRDLSDGFDPTGGADEAADAPEDCEGAVAAVRDLMSEYSSMGDLPAGELLAATTVLQSVSTMCSVDEVSALFSDPAFQEWTGG